MAVGDLFEKKVFTLFSEELANGGLPLRAESCEIFSKKGYYSKDRNSNIIVDVSIEAYLPNQDHWWILMVIECKDYGRSVPVDDVEEFHTKIQQIAGDNVKGVMVSSKGFQKGALTFAQSKGIAMVRILDGINLKWILTRAATGFITHDQMEKSRANINSGLLEENYTSDNIDFYGNVGDSFTHSVRQLFELLLIEYLEQSAFRAVFNTKRKQGNTVPYIAKQEIEGMAQNILKELHYSSYEVPIESYSEELAKSKGITLLYVNDLGKDTLGFEILGKITFEPAEIQISRAAHANLFSRKFTLAHELGHYFLNHQQHLRSEYYSDEDFERETASTVTIEEIRRMEWQANHFASSLLLPEKIFIQQFNSLLSNENIKDRGFGILFVDKQECNLNTFYKVTNKLIDSFRVSRKVIELRLKDLQLLNDRR